MIVNTIYALKALRHENGLFSASRAVKTGYHRIWIRDNIYSAIGLEVLDVNEAIRTYQALLDLFLKYEYKIDAAIREKPDSGFDYIHPRYDSHGNEINEEWGYKQNDMIGSFLFKIADLTKKGHQVLRSLDDFRILQKLVFYLSSIEYWHDKDNGIWEETEEVHASSVGACVAGLKNMKKLVFNVPIKRKNTRNILFQKKDSFVKKKPLVPMWLIKNGKKTLNRLLPGESETKETDLALLSLIYPYNIVNEKQKQQILKNVEEKLVRKNGIIRYVGDRYYSNGAEAEWCFGFPWLVIIYKNLDAKKHRFYLNKTFSVMKNNEMPELYFANSTVYNENCPLGWGQALCLVALS